jgi:hypothetical protein
VPDLTPPAGKAAPPPAEAAAALAESVRPFNTSAVRLEWNNRRWQLVADGVMLKDFGVREQEARQALRLVQDLHLNQYGTVGSPSPVMEYWLSDGRAPQGLAGGLRALPLDPTGLRVEQIQGQWCLRDSQRVLFNFGQRADDARQALAVVRKYGFTQVGVIGQGITSMFVFTARPGLPGGTTSPLSGAGRHLNVPPFPRHKGGPRVSTSPGEAPAVDLVPLFPYTGLRSVTSQEAGHAHPKQHSGRSVVGPRGLLPEAQRQRSEPRRHGPGSNPRHQLQPVERPPAKFGG